MATLVRAPIDAAALIRAAARPDCGAIALFLGTSRDHHEGRRVARLEYEAYESMAVAALDQLERDACARFPIAACTIVHRLGEVPLAEASMAVVVAAAHRAAAFDASRWVVDELKRTVPIWKKEHFTDGEVQWVKGTTLAPGPSKQPS